MQQHPSGAVSRRAGPGRAAAAGPLRGRALAPLTPLIPLSMCRHASLTSRRSLPRCAMPLGLRPVCHAAVVGCEGVDHPALHLVTGLLHTDSILLGLLAPVFATLHLCIVMPQPQCYRLPPAPVFADLTCRVLCHPACTTQPHLVTHARMQVDIYSFLCPGTGGSSKGVALGLNYTVALSRTFVTSRDFGRGGQRPFCGSSGADAGGSNRAF